MMAPQSDETIWFRAPVPIKVRIEGSPASVLSYKEQRFTETFRVGRDPSCQVQINDATVSRVHMEVRFDGNQWWIQDLGSANGIYVEGVRVQEIPLLPCTRLELGRGGITLVLVMEGAEEMDAVTTVAAPADEPFASVTQVFERYFSPSSLQDAGEYTMIFQKAAARLKKKQSKKYGTLLGVILFCLVGVGGIAVYQQMKLNKLRKTAEEIFYNMKAIELQVSQIEEMVLSSADPLQRAEMAKKRDQMKDMEKNYAHFVEELGIYTKEMSEEEKIIFRVARIFGECELNMPEGFTREVQKYIQKWRASDRLRRAIHHATQKGYSKVISEAMLVHHLPPQFFYLALKESGFREQVVGPKTRYGFAKGIWQFIPATAAQYGLRTGPLVELPLYDPRDERYTVERSTEAAARYLKKIYSTEAQASGLLVMASYNWGENNIRQIIRKMPANPRERNFWRLLKQYKIPRQTYDYVFYIIAAATIGENPHLFGFDFDNPLSA